MPIVYTCILLTWRSNELIKTHIYTGLHVYKFMPSLNPITYDVVLGSVLHAGDFYNCSDFYTIYYICLYVLFFFYWKTSIIQDVKYAMLNIEY